MDIEKMDIEEVLGLAARTEIQGRKFYLELSQKVEHPEVKKKLESLAADEERHEAIVRELYKQTMGKELGEIPDKGVPDIVSAIRDMNPNKRTQLLELIDMAIGAERIAAAFYGRGVKLTDDPATRKIFEEMEAEEDGHYNMLIAEKSALLGDNYWFDIGSAGMMEE
jgi:rubrerythrin